MINLILSIIAGTCIGIVCGSFLFESVAACIVVGFIVFLACSICLNRITSKKIKVIMEEANAILSDLSQIKSPDTLKRMMPKIVDRAIEKFNEGYKYQFFQFGIASMLNGQIGSLYYMGQRFDEAEPYLEKAFMQQSEALAMAACCKFRRGDRAGMKLTFEKALRFAQKKPMIYHIYAWCLTQTKYPNGSPCPEEAKTSDLNEAIRRLNECKALNPKDEITLKNLDSLRNGSKMDMSSFGPQWYQFFLETPDNKAIQQLQQLQRIGSPFAKHIRK